MLKFSELLRMSAKGFTFLTEFLVLNTVVAEVLFLVVLEKGLFLL